MENATVQMAPSLIDVDTELVARISQVVIAQIQPGLKELNEGIEKFLADTRWRIEERLSRAEKILLNSVSALGEEVSRLEMVVESTTTTTTTTPQLSPTGTARAALLSASEAALPILTEELRLEGEIRPIVVRERRLNTWALLGAGLVGAFAAIAGSYVANHEAENRAMREAW